MAELVLFHSGKELPGFLEYTFKQIRVFNPDVTVYFLTDEHLLINEVFYKYDIIAKNKDLFYSDKIAQFESVYKSTSFWTITATRFIYIENFLREYKLKNVYHFENDVLLYYDLNQYHMVFQNLYKTLAITPGGPDKSMTGFMFIKDWKSLAAMTQFFIDILQKYGIQGIIRKYKIGMVHEMSLMKIYGVEKGDFYLSELPTLPDYHSIEFNAFDSIFDPASWGQFVGGTTDGKPGAKPTDHYIGQLLIEHPEYDVVWGKDEENRKIPYFKYDNYEVKINNLHIHSKNLHLYTSK